MTQEQFDELKRRFRNNINNNRKWATLSDKEKRKDLKGIDIPVRLADKVYDASINKFNGIEDTRYIENIVRYDGVKFLSEKDDIKKLIDEGYFVIGVHNGIFHCDDVTACAILDLLLENIYANLPLKPSFKVKKVAIVRTRNPEILKKCSVCVDIGGGELDHHSGGNKQREDGVSYSSAGLVWKKHGNFLIKLLNPNFGPSRTNIRFDRIDKEVIRFIDADDNGQLIERELHNIGKTEEADIPDNKKYYTSFDFDFITLFNPSWHEEKPNFNDGFIRAFEVTIRTFNNCLNSIVLEEKIKDENESISLEEQEQFIKDTAIKYQKSLLNNFSKEPNVMKIYEDNEDIMKALSEINNEQLTTAVNENIKLFLEQHSFKYNTEKDKKEILEQKIRQIVDEFYATKIIEVLIQNPNNIKSSCLIIPAQTMPWKKGIFAYNEEHKDNPIRFVMYPYPNGGWAIECVQKSSSIEDRYTKITPLLSKLPYKLRKLIEFVHKNRFFARTNKDISDDEAKNALYNLCELSTKNQNIKKKISSAKLLVERKFTGLINFINKPKDNSNRDKGIDR